LDALKKRLGNVHANQRNSVRSQFLKRLNSFFTAAFSLRRIDHLLCLIVLLLLTVAGLGVAEDNSKQN
jgi:hypothetical protein